MKEIQLTQGKFAIVDDEDFERINKHKWYAVKGKHTWYGRRNSKSVNGKRHGILMHREILFMEDSSIFIDHINQDGLYNIKTNLRQATNAENCSNRKPHANTTSKFLGVHWVTRDQRWVVKVCKDYKEIYVGRFKDENQAALAYNQAAVIHHGEFANLNKV